MSEIQKTWKHSAWRAKPTANEQAAELNLFIREMLVVLRRTGISKRRGYMVKQPLREAIRCSMKKYDDLLTRIASGITN